MAVIKTIEKGESLTFGFVLPETYNIANLQAVKIYIGSSIYEHKMDGRTVRVELESNQTALITGRNIVHFVIDDAVFGIKKINCGELEVLPTQATHKDESINTGYDVEIVLSINVETVSVGSVLYDTLKGDKGDAGTIEVGTVTTGDAGTDVVVENVGTQSEAVLNFTIPRGDAGYTPCIGENGNWFINGVDTGVQAEGDATQQWVIDNFVVKESGKSLVDDTEITRLASVTNQTLEGLGGETAANKQNSLAADGTGAKYPTVDAVNAMIVGELGNSETKVVNQKTHLDNISFPFYNAGFGHTDTANQLKMLSAIKSMRLIGNWDRTKNFAIRSLYRNHATYKYMITLYELSSIGAIVGATYYTSGEIEVTESGEGKHTVVSCPTDANGRSIDVVIDYNMLTSNTTDYNFAISPYNWLIKKAYYDKTNIYDSDFTNLKISPAFVDAGFGFTNTADQILVHQAIKDFRLIGEWDKTKNYAIRNLYKNDGTSKYRLSINEIAADGSVVGIIYDSGVVDVTEAGTGKYTRVLYPTVSNRSVELLIDYNRLSNSLYSFFAGSLNFVVRKDKIDRTALNGELINELIRSTAFYNAKFGIAETDARLLTTSAIKSIRLIGDWSVDGNYRINVLYKNNSTHKYKLEISKVDNNGNTIVSQGYNSGIYVITEAGLGKNTHVVFPVVDNKSVEMVVDYNILSSSYNEGSRNYIIRRENIQNIQNTALTPVNGALQTFDYAGYLATRTTPGSQSLRRRNNSAFMNVINKRGGFYYRVDDNSADLVFESIFEKYGYAITYSINAALSEATRFVDAQRRGHLICDHTPDHSCNYFTIPTGADALFTALIGSGIASITNGKATLQITVLDGVTDVTNPVTPAIDLVNLKIGADGGYNLISGTNRIEGDFAAFTAKPYFYVYVDNATGDKIGWVPVKASSVLAGSCTVTKQDGTAILFSANESINMYAQRTGSDKITLSEDAAYCIMLAGIEWFRVLGLQKPYAFCQPGGTTPRMNASAATGAIERLGLDAAFFSDSAVETVLTYNHTRNYPKLSYHPITTYVDYMTLADLQGVKELLSYYAATRKIVAIMSHHYIAKLYFEGATEAERIENYRKFIYDLMTWAYEQNIPVLSHSETVELLNNSTTNRSENIMPDLYTDRAVQGKPDGYELGAGVVWDDTDGMHEDKIHSLKLTGNGELFTITDLGGLEKGNNEFEIWIKGTTGGIVSVQFGTFGTAVFTLGVTAAWQKFKLADSTGITSLDIPYTTNFLTITAIASNNAGTDISVSGMKLKGI